MKLQSNLRIPRSLSPDSPVESRSFGLHRASSVIAITALALLAGQAPAQQPSPIPNWTGQPGTSSGQYAAAPQYGYGQPQGQYQQYGQPQYQQPPAYQQPAVPYAQQPQYQQPSEYGQQQAYGAPDQGSVAPYQPQQALNPDRLEQLVAPIALYPDNLVSMILAASTYPAQVSAADQWLRMQGGAPPEQIAVGANAQTSWDPSVKSLTAFPQVLDQLAQNLQWTTDLGNAYYNQPQDVMQTIQVMRGRAQAAGYLQNTPQQEVIQDQGNIEIAPPTPDVVYVPQYNPWAVYGQPVNPYPGYNILGAIGSFLGNAFLQFGPGIAMHAFAATPFGWLGWGLDWLAHAIFFNHDLWSTHSYSVHDWGFAHGGARYWGPRGEIAGYRSAGWGTWNQQHFFRSGLDRSALGNGVRPVAGAMISRGAERPYGNDYNRGYQSYGNTRENGYIQNGGNLAYRGPQPTGRPQQFAQSRGGYDTQRAGAGYGSSGLYSHPLQNYGMRPGFGGSYSEPSRAPSTGNRAYSGYGSYGAGGSNTYRESNVARAPSSGGFHLFGGGHSSGSNFGGGSYKAPKESSRGWGGSGSFKAPKAPKAPHYSSGGHSGGGHSSGGHSGHHH